jgi:hypothetical protein
VPASVVRGWRFETQGLAGHDRPLEHNDEGVMHSKITVEVQALASAQLVRPDVARAQWLVYPIALHVWGLHQQETRDNVAGDRPTSTGFETDPFAAVDQLEDFDAWRVGGGVAFRW